MKIYHLASLLLKAIKLNIHPLNNFHFLSFTRKLRPKRFHKIDPRAPVLTINGSDDGFDGFRIGVAGFDNPMRDAATDDTIRRIGQGFKLKMDDMGNILVRHGKTRSLETDAMIF
jgi:hypothetical protein